MPLSPLCRYPLDFKVKELLMLHNHPLRYQWMIALWRINRWTNYLVTLEQVLKELNSRVKMVVLTVLFVLDETYFLTKFNLLVELNTLVELLMVTFLNELG